MALSVGINEPVVAPELARYRAKLVYRDGRGLLVLLGSKALSDGDKRCLMDLLERAVERESALPLWSPAQELYPSELPADVKARLEGIREKRGKLEEPAKKQEEAALKLLDTYIDEMGILVEAGLPVQAEQVIREGSRRGQEEEKFQSLRGERCPLDLPAGLFWDYYLLSSHYYPSSPGDLLPSYLHSRDLPEKRKQALLSYMRECFHLNGSGGAGLNP